MVDTLNELTSASYTATLQDTDGNAIPVAAIVTAQLTLTDVDTGEVVNGRDAQNILNANNVTIHATSGLLTWSIQPADNAVQTAGVQQELRRAVFDVVYNTDQRLVHETYWLVKNLSEVS